MFSAAVVRRSVVLIVAVFLLGAPALAQSQAGVAAEELARQAARAQVPATMRAQFGAEPDWRVTVLMVMAPGAYGIRRGASVADPILCTTDGCYVSNGADIPARFMPRRRALGVGNTLGARAGACRQSLSCVFRDVAFEYPALLQPVDLHVLKHDRRRPQRIIADSDCRLAAGRLTCSRGIYAEDYALWIVPERLAAMAGPEALERALRDGLSYSRSAEASPRPMR
jgi:colicin import membrane protein